MYIDYHLRFTDQAEADAVLYNKTRPAGYAYTEAEEKVFIYETAYGEHATIRAYTEEECEDDGYTFLRTGTRPVLVDPDPTGGEWEYTPKYAAVDVIGTIYKPTGKMLPSENGDAVDEMAPVEGWHVNVRHTADAPELDAYKVEVATPVRGWA